MIYELKNTQDFIKVANVIDNSKNITNTFAHSVVQGNTKGWIFVDNINTPTSAMIWPKEIECGEVIFAGNHLNQKFNDYVLKYVDEEIKPRMIEQGLKYFECYGDNSNWDNEFRKIFKSRKIYIENMLRYNFIGTKHEKSFSLPNDFIISKIDTTIIENTKLKNKEKLLLQISHSWGSIEKFLHHSYGFIVIHNSTVIGWCYMCAKNGKYVQYDVEILEKYWGKKLGTIVSKQSINESIIRGDIPEWQVSEVTTASQKIAENLGFMHNSTYPVFQMKL